MSGVSPENHMPRELRFLEGLPQELSLGALSVPRPLTARHSLQSEGSNREALWSIAPAERIRPEPSLVEGHVFQHLIRKPGLLELSDLIHIQRTVNMAVHVYDSGAIPAASNPASSYSVHSWTRDTALIALALFTAGNRAAALKALVHLGSFYGDALQRDRFIGFHFHPDPHWLYQHGDPNRHHPHVRARIERGRLQESPDEWSHSQLDAIGLWLAVTFGIARSMRLTLSGLDTYISKTVNPINQVDSIYSVALRFLCRIRFWEQSDHGAWEDRKEPRRASSTNACLMALKEAFAYFEEHGWSRITICDSPGQPTLRDEMQYAIQEGTKALEQRIPLDGRVALETERFPSDAALAFLLFPFNVGLNQAQAEAILRELYQHRLGPVGFTRRDADEYVGEDYAHNPHHPVFVDPHRPGYRAAEWTLFDPLIASFYYQTYLNSDGSDRRALTLADLHCKRALSQVTSQEDLFWKECEQRLVTVPALRVPEAYWWDSRAGRWRPNENSPLLMAEAAFALMLERAVAALTLRSTDRGSAN